MDYRYQPAYLQLDCIADQCAKTLRGDCGVFALLFITLCRIAGIPARWQSGLAVRPGRVGPHDWAMFYLAPPRLAVGGLLLRLLRPPQRGGRPPGPLLRQPGPLADGSQFRLPGPPDAPMPAWRQDPYDNQCGELMVDGRGLDAPERAWGHELLDFTLL